MACLFFVVDVLIWRLSQHVYVKKAFLSRTKRFGSFLFCFFFSNLGLPSAKSLQNGRFWFLLSRRKIEPVTTHKMASHLMDMNIIFLENMCLTDLNHYKHSKMTIFWVRFNTAKTPVLNSTPPVLWEVHTKLVLILTPVGVSLIPLSVKFNTGGC